MMKEDRNGLASQSNGIKKNQPECNGVLRGYKEKKKKKRDSPSFLHFPWCNISNLIFSSMQIGNMGLGSIHFIVPTGIILIVFSLNQNQRVCIESFKRTWKLHTSSTPFNGLLLSFRY